MASIYVASLSDYNNGVLHGEWYDLDDYANHEDLTDAVQEMLAKSPTAKEDGLPAEEWAIHDHEGFGGYEVSEYAWFDMLFALHEAFNDHGNGFAAYLKGVTSENPSTPEDVESLVESFQDEFVGEMTLAEYAEEYVEDCLFTPETSDSLRNYFDYEAFARDMGYDGYCEVHYGTTTYTFRPA
ncbi:antirestriction protein [Rhodococcus phage RGL3]|uniref:Antirestriction protein n=1 Tax=Rhodococcus phage RGL3 TaxID=2922221 RepID=G9FHQ1_9CAUD|nr:anti-restriction protein [Rhodococcus phage RGL3]AEV52139.1 antirestriction protein [Rhodococcus phage RGL3]